MRTAIIAACTLMASAAVADEIIPGTFYTGNDVHNFCLQNPAMALGYVAGLNDAHVVAQGAMKHIENTTNSLKEQMPHIVGIAVDFEVKWVGRHCPPSGVTVKQMTDVFCKYLRENPQERHLSATVLFSEALLVWPCPQ